MNEASKPDLEPPTIFREIREIELTIFKAANPTSASSVTNKVLQAASQKVRATNQIVVEIDKKDVQEYEGVREQYVTREKWFTAHHFALTKAGPVLKLSRRGFTVPFAILVAVGGAAVSLAARSTSAFGAMCLDAIGFAVLSAHQKLLSNVGRYQALPFLALQAELLDADKTFKNGLNGQLKAQLAPLDEAINELLAARGLRAEPTPGPTQVRPPEPPAPGDSLSW